ncbi:hypothetical protein RRG08_049268 [Elysia crispata]|uniref:Uncharacterized protein n=1 Tax=Elysia crispata TaxID=231223 RepID=A0AAE0ZNL9_9GAST|nr:hypothetical protein RRG08_049268 [Elysia crispata]
MQVHPHTSTSALAQTDLGPVSDLRWCLYGSSRPRSQMACHSAGAKQRHLAAIFVHLGVANKREDTSFQAGGR